MEISQRDRRAIRYGGLGLGLILLYLLVVEPLLDGYDAMVREHRTLSAKVARAMRDTKKTKYLTEYVKSEEDRTGTVSSPRPYSEQITAMSEKIMTAGQCGVQIKNSFWVAPRLWPEDTKLEMAQIQIDAEGNWEAVCRFLAALYKTDGVFSVEQMDLAGKGGQLTLKLTLSVLVQAAQPEAQRWTK